jgi:hypothetical protein
MSSFKLKEHVLSVKESQTLLLHAGCTVLNVEAFAARKEHAAYLKDTISIFTMEDEDLDASEVTILCVDTDTDLTKLNIPDLHHLGSVRFGEKTIHVGALLKPEDDDDN